MVRYCVEILMPLYSVFAVFVYFRPGFLLARLDTTAVESVVGWLMWGLLAALTGVLAISALFLTFYIVYSPFYLLQRLKLLFAPQKWVDRRELRFYLACFVMLCVLAGLAVVNPTAAAVTFTILAGSAQLLWRVII